MSKINVKFEDAERDILDAVSMLADPVVQTLSPRGGNVLFQPGETPHSAITNDGITIAKAIQSDDFLKESIIKTIRESCLRTNVDAGDGTTTSILLTSVLVKEGIRMRRDGMNPIQLVKELRSLAVKLLDRVKQQALVAENDKELLDIARVSANNDENIASMVLKTVKTAGIDGMVFIEPNTKQEDEIIEDVGFIIKTGMFRPELRTDGFTASYASVPILITDKRLYYKKEAETILRNVFENGHKEVVIVARDFIGECLNYLVANHTSGAFKILLVKDNNASDTNYESLEDLAAYVDGRVITEKQGSLVDNITWKDFSIVDRVFSDGAKTIIAKDNKTKANPQLSVRVAAVRAELAKNPDDEKLKTRIASLTSGMVTLKIWAPTQTEMQEKIYRFEDSVNATRAAMKHGYLPGGGIALINAYVDKDYPEEYRSLFRRYCEASLRQIAKNCGKDANTVIENVKNLQEDVGVTTIGYNAVSGDYEDMLKAGIIDPYHVLRLAIENSVSAAANILSVNYFVINKPKEDLTKEK